MLDDYLKAIRASEALRRKMASDMAAVTKVALGNSSLFEVLRVSDAARKDMLVNRIAGFGAFDGLNASRAAIQAAVAGVSMPKSLVADALTSIRLAGVGGNTGLLASMASAQGYLSRITSQYESIFSSPALRDIVSRWREALELKTEFAVVMSELGWPPPMDLPPQVMRRIVDAFEAAEFESDGDAFPRLLLEVDRTVLQYYREEAVQEKLSAWRSRHLLARRFHILEAGVNAHCRGEYWLSVPVLLAQTEGIVADGFNHKGRMSGSKYAAYRTELFKTTDDELALAAINEAVVEFCVSIVYVAFAHGQPASSALSRHAILHGGDVDYGTEANSLKVLLFIDFVQNSFKLTVLESSDIYHSDDCAALAHSTSRGRSYRSLDDVIAEGKRPCKRCHPPC